MKKDFQAKCRTLESVIAQIKAVFSSPDFKVERFQVDCITSTGATLRLRFNKEDVK